jgi:hypothetical protein
MSEEKKPTLAIFWGDTRELLSKRERDEVLASAVPESITPEEILLRDHRTQRLIIITSVDEGHLFCSLCSNDEVRRSLGKTCPEFATCLGRGTGIGGDPVLVNGKK